MTSKMKMKPLSDDKKIYDSLTRNLHNVNLKSQKIDTLTIDKELKMFLDKKNESKRNNVLEPLKYKTELTELKTSKIDDHKVGAINKFSKKPVVVIKSFPEINETLPPKKPVVVIKSMPEDIDDKPKKPVVLIKKNVTNLNNYDKPKLDKKPIVNIVKQKPLEDYIDVKTNLNDHNYDVPKLNINFDEPPTEEQIKRSSVIIKNNNDNIPTNEIKFEDELKKIESISETKSFELLNNETENKELINDKKYSFDNLVGTKFETKITNFEFEALILDSVDKKIKTFSFKSHILNKINVFIKNKDIALFYGPSNSGKTTLLNIICNKETIDSGEYIINDRLYGELSDKQLKDFINSKIFLIYKQLSLDSSETIFSHFKQIFMGYENNKIFTLEDIIEKFNIHNYMNKHFNTLTMMEKQIILIVYAIINNYQLLLLDEPSLAEDEQDDYIFKNVLRTARSIFNKTIIIASTNKRLMDISTKSFTLNKGKIK